MRSITIFALFCCAFLPISVHATPEFSRRAMLSCNACHSVGARLNAFGTAFKLNGFRIPKLTSHGSAPIAVSLQGVYSSEPDDTGLPKAIVDEVDYLSAGPIGKHFNYGTEVYHLDGGTIGSTREAWVEYRTNQNQSLPLQIRAGLQVLPIPVDPERFRETNAHYALYDQTAGDNPFTFFDTHEAVRFGIGSETRGLHAALVAAASDGQMITLQDAIGGSITEVYRYDGRQSVFGAADDFWRQGYAFSLYRDRLALNTALQTGFDSNASGDGTALSTSGGFVQVRLQVGAQAFAIARYDGVNDSDGTFGRSFTIGAGTQFARVFRLEVEDQIFHAPETHNAFSIVLRTGASTIHEGGLAY